MSTPKPRRMLWKLILAAAGLVLAHQAGAQVMLQTESELHALATVDTRLDHDPATVPLEEGRDALRLAADLGFKRRKHDSDDDATVWELSLQEQA